MDEQQQAKAFIESGLWDGALWLLAVLSGTVTMLAKRDWKREWKSRDDKIAALEQLCEDEHKQREANLTQHAVADARVHMQIRNELAHELKLVNERIERNNDNAEERARLLGEKLDRHYEGLTTHIININKSLGGTER